MEKTILTALNNYISEEINTGKLEGHLFKTKNKEGDWIPMERKCVNNTWNEFEKLAKKNADNYDTICRDLKNICKGSSFDFTTKVSTKLSTFENYIKTLLLLIDDKKYRLDGQGKLSKDGRALTLEGMIRDIKCRSNFVKSQKLGESMTANCEKLTISIDIIQAVTLYVPFRMAAAAHLDIAGERFMSAPPECLTDFL